MKGSARRLLMRARTVPQARPVPSPCICVCQMDPASGWCEGCFRTLDEIAAWTSLDDAARLAVWQRLQQRASTVETP